MPTKPLYGAKWQLTDEVDRSGNNAGFMIDEAGHRRHRSNVPCFLGGSKHSPRFLGRDVRHCVTVEVYGCVYCGRDTTKSIKKHLCRRCYKRPHITPENTGGKQSMKICIVCLAELSDVFMSTRWGT